MYVREYIPEFANGASGLSNEGLFYLVKSSYTFPTRNKVTDAFWVDIKVLLGWAYAKFFHRFSDLGLLTILKMSDSEPMDESPFRLGKICRLTNLGV